MSYDTSRRDNTFFFFSNEIRLNHNLSHIYTPYTQAFPKFIFFFHFLHHCSLSLSRTLSPNLSLSQSNTRAFRYTMATTIYIFIFAVSDVKTIIHANDCEQTRRSSNEV